MISINSAILDSLPDLLTYLHKIVGQIFKITYVPSF